MIPSITYKSFTPYCPSADSADLQVNFMDGDGDIGYDSQDSSAPYDFYALQLHDSAGVYVKIIISGKYEAPYTYHIPNITPTGKNKSLNGIIQIRFKGNWYINIPDNGNQSYHRIEYQVWIFDRAGHKSNVITTPPLTICQ